MKSSRNLHDTIHQISDVTYNVASQMTDFRRYSGTVVSVVALEVHSRYAYDNAARIASITHAKSEIAAGQAWNGTSVLPASITPAQTIAACQLASVRNFGVAPDNRLLEIQSNRRGQLAEPFLADGTSTAKIASTLIPNRLACTSNRE